MPNAYLEQLRAENEQLRKAVASEAKQQEMDTPQPTAAMNPSSSRDPALPDLSSLKQENDQRWHAKMGVDQAIGDTVSNVANIGTSAAGVGMDMAAGALKDIGVNSVARKVLDVKKDMQFNMEEFSKYVDPTDENIIPKLVGRLVPYAVAAYKSKNPGLVTSGMAGLQAAGSGDPNEPYLWTLLKQGGTMGLSGLANAGMGVASGSVRTLPDTAKTLASVAANPTSLVKNAGTIYQAGKNKLSAMVTPTADTRAVNALTGALGGNANNLLDYQNENAPTGPSSDPYSR